MRSSTKIVVTPNRRLKPPPVLQSDDKTSALRRVISAEVHTMRNRAWKKCEGRHVSARLRGCCGFCIHGPTPAPLSLGHCRRMQQGSAGCAGLRGMVWRLVSYLRRTKLAEVRGSERGPGRHAEAGG